LSKECQLAGILVEIAAVFTFAPLGSPDCMQANEGDI